MYFSKSSATKLYFNVGYIRIVLIEGSGLILLFQIVSTVHNFQFQWLIIVFLFNHIQLHGLTRIYAGCVSRVTRFLFILLFLLLYIYNAPCIRVKNLLKGANKVMLNNFK